MGSKHKGRPHLDRLGCIERLSINRAGSMCLTCIFKGRAKCRKHGQWQNIAPTQWSAGSQNPGYGTAVKAREKHLPTYTVYRMPSQPATQASRMPALADPSSGTSYYSSSAPRRDRHGRKQVGFGPMP